METVLAGRKPGSLFVVVHQAVVPCNARSSWGVQGHESQQERRQRLVNLLGKHRAIVLSGHLHKQSSVERDTEFGSFTQLSVSSVAHRLDGTPKDFLTGADNYTPELVDLEPNHSPGTVVERRAIPAEERSHIRQFDGGDSWGRAKLRVVGDKVEAEIYQMLDGTTWKIINVTPGAG